MNVLILFCLTFISVKPLDNDIFSSNYYNVKRADTFLYFATIRGLEIYKSGPTPKFLSRTPTNGLAYGLDVIDNYAYIADYYTGICVIDISNPYNPKIIGYFNVELKVFDVKTRGNYAYVIDKEKGLIILDISDRRSPKKISQCSDIGSTFSIVLRDSMAFIGKFDGPMVIINISNPEKPFVLGYLPNDSIKGYCVDSYLENSIAYINCHIINDCDTFNFIILNIKNPKKPIFISGLNLPMTNKGMLKQGNLIFINDQDSGTCIIDVSNIKSPTVIGYFNAKHNFGYSYAFDNNKIIIPNAMEGFSIFDISYPKKPLLLYNKTNIEWRYFTFDDYRNMVYMIGYKIEGKFPNTSILKIFNILKNGKLLECGEYAFEGRAILYENSLAYPYLSVSIGSGHPSRESLYTVIMDVSNPLKPRKIKSLEGSGPNAIHNNILYSLFGCILRKFEIGHDTCWSGSLIFNDPGFDIVINNEYAYISTPDSLLIINIDTGVETGSYYHGKPYSINMSLTYPYLAMPYTPKPGSTYGLMIFNISNPFLPTIVSDTIIESPAIYPNTIQIMGCFLTDSLLFWGRGHYGFDIWNIKDKSSIYRITTQETPYLATHCYPSGNSNIYVKDNIIYILEKGGLEMYELITY